MDGAGNKKDKIYIIGTRADKLGKLSDYKKLVTGMGGWTSRLVRAKRCKDKEDARNHIITTAAYLRLRLNKLQKSSSDALTDDEFADLEQQVGRILGLGRREYYDLDDLKADRGTPQKLIDAIGMEYLKHRLEQNLISKTRKAKLKDIREDYRWCRSRILEISSEAVENQRNLVESARSVEVRKKNMEKVKVQVSELEQERERLEKALDELKKFTKRSAREKIKCTERRELWDFSVGLQRKYLILLIGCRISWGDSSYSGSTVQECADVEEVLADFKKNLEESASKLEEEHIAAAMEIFQQFSENFQAQYPSSTEELEKQRRLLFSELKGTITNYAHMHISENDPDFQKTLKMRPGDEKKRAQKKEMDAIINRAETEFYRELQQAMDNLHNEFNRRLINNLEKQESALKEQMKSCELLRDEIEKGIVQLEAHEDRQRVLEEVGACLEEMLPKEE